VGVLLGVAVGNRVSDDNGIRLGRELGGPEGATEGSAGAKNGTAVVGLDDGFLDGLITVGTAESRDVGTVVGCAVAG
jgi:hypothetical protein